MTNAELIQKIRKEIERLKKANAKLGHTNDIERHEESAYNNACDAFLSILSTLEEAEKPMNPDEGLNKEINRFREIFRNECDARIVGEIARHFAQWGAEHSGSSETPNDLKEAVKNYIYKAADSPGDDWTTDDIRNAYIAGYKLHEANTPLPEDTVLFNKGVEEGKRLMMEEEIEKTWLEYECYNEDYDKVAEMRWNEFENVARHFYELGKNSVPIPEDIILFKSKELFPEARKIYLWGYEDGKKQMMEEAVDADVNTYEEVGIGKSYAEFVVEMPTKNLGDKVRIIILPKED